MSAHDLLTPDQLARLRDDLGIIAKDHGEALLDDARMYLAPESSASDLRQLEEARIELLAAQSRAVIATGEESEAAELALGDAEANLDACLDHVRLSREWVQIHARGQLFARLRSAIREAAPILLDASAKIVRSRMGA